MTITHIPIDLDTKDFRTDLKGNVKFTRFKGPVCQMQEALCGSNNIK